MAEFHVIIPARYHSVRLPAKALKLIGDKTMIEHVCIQASLSGAQSVTVATDSSEIQETVRRSGFESVITRGDHPSGSDRVYEAADAIGLKASDIIVNVQGDEPFIPPQNIELVASLIAKKPESMSTLCSRIETAEEALDPNAVKVVFSKKNKALYFSRSLIPYNRDNPVAIGEPLTSEYFRHIGIYAYHKDLLKIFIDWPVSPLEHTESLEQLRILDNGFEIEIECLAQSPPPGVDTHKDLEAARSYYSTELSGSDG